MRGELFRALGTLLGVPQPELQGVADALELGPLPSRSEHADLFTLEIVPYASVYLGNEGRIGGAARERIAGFWNALEIGLPKEPDHLATLLALCAELEAAESQAAPDVAAALRHRRRALLGEHLLPWLPGYLLKLGAMAPPFYAAWAGLLDSALRDEAKGLDPPALDCLHWAAAEPPPAANECDLDELVDALLAPVRGGVILTRSDLAGAARQLGVAARIGERRFMLEAMLRQRPREVLAWLERFLREVEQRYAAADRQWRPYVDRALSQVGQLRACVTAMLRESR